MGSMLAAPPRSDHANLNRRKIRRRLPALGLALALAGATSTRAANIDFVPDGITVTSDGGGWYYVQAHVRYDAGEDMTSMSPRIQIKKNSTVVVDTEWITGDIQITSACPGTNPCSGSCVCNGTENGWCNNNNSISFCMCANCGSHLVPGIPGFRLQLQPGDTLRVLADVDSECTELNETNNTLTLNL